MGFAKPRRCRRAGALLPHRFSFSPVSRMRLAPHVPSRGVFFSVALSVGSPRPAVSWHLALWSPDFPHGRPFGLPPRLSSLLALLFYSIPPPLSMRGTPLKSDFIPLKSSPCQLGCPPEKPSHRPCSIPHSGMPPFLACCQTCPAAVFLPFPGRHPWDPYHRRPVRLPFPPPCQKWTGKKHLPARCHLPAGHPW